LGGEADPDDADRASARELSLVMRFIHGANSNNYKSYLTHLCNSYLDGNNIYPTTLHEAYNILQRRESDTATAGVSSHDGVAFTICGEVICFNCGKARTLCTQLHPGGLLQWYTEKGWGSKQAGFGSGIPPMTGCTLRNATLSCYVSRRWSCHPSYLAAPGQLVHC
jgi:hypothetical protein